MLKNKNKFKVKGSVLYTVVAVMSILTVFVFAALTLAANANRRAHNNYANNQTQYTARSVVDLVWNMIENNEGLRNTVNALNKGDSINVSVDGLDSSMGQISAASIKCIENTADNKSLKLTVTVTMLGHENTIAAYYAPEQQPASPGFNYALVSLDGGGANNANIYGGMSYAQNIPSDVESINGTVLGSPIEINGNFSTSSGSNVINIYGGTNENKGMFINGNFTINNNGAINSILKSTPLAYRSLPYMYINEKINFPSSNVTIASDSSPMIVMADSLHQGHDYDTGWYGPDTSQKSIFGDVYLYGTEQTFLSDFTVYPFNNDILKKKNYTGGNIYSFGDIYYTFGDSTNYELANNITVGSLVFNGLNNNISVHTTGSIVAKNFNTTNITNFNIDGGLFVDPVMFNCDEYSSPTINNVQYIHADMYDHASVSLSLESKQNPDGNQYWNADEYMWDAEKGEYVKSKDSENHNYSFKLSDFKDSNGKTYSVDDFNYILDSVKVEINPNHYGNFNGGWFGGWTERPLEWPSVSMIAGIKNDKQEEYATIAPSYGWAPACSFEQDNKFINVLFNQSGNPDSRVELQNCNNTITFKMNTMTITYWDWDKFTTEYVKTIETKNVNINANVYSKNRNIKKVIDYLKKVNDKAFEDNGNIIQLDDIDKSVKLVRTGNEGNYNYHIEKADLTGKEGNEENADFKKVAYNEIPYVDTEGNLIYKRETKYVDEAGVTEADGWISEFTLDNYDKFLKAVVEVVTFPESMIRDNIMKSKGGFVDNSFLNKTAEGKPQIAEDAENKVADAFNSEGAKNAKKTIYDSSNCPALITQSCTIKLELWETINNDVKFEPDDDIYVILDGVNLNGGNFIVDDTKGKVNFLIPDGKEFNLNFFSSVFTDYFSNDSEIDVKQTPTKVDPTGKVVADDEKIPGIYFYSDGNSAINVKNGYLSAYIIMPNGKLNFSDPKKTCNWNYDGTNIENMNPGITPNKALVGAAICKSVTLSNICTFAYVNPDPLGNNASNLKSSGMPKLQYYQAY